MWWWAEGEVTGGVVVIQQHGERQCADRHQKWSVCEIAASTLPSFTSSSGDIPRNCLI